MYSLPLRCCCILCSLARNYNRPTFCAIVVRGFFEEALSLAEKYRDFDILIEICESLNDQEKLQHYMNLFNSEVRFLKIVDYKFTLAMGHCHE